ncbi:MAG: cob(I)yrinic acid a,c-diamide adenosyltransferase [Pseudomonadota bacterium]
MAKFDKIYTRSGDKGMTSLANGERRDKFDLRIEAYGTIDETNCVIGIARTYIDDSQIDKILEKIQNELFEIGSDLATPQNEENDPKNIIRISEEQVKRLENEIDAISATLKPLSNFILPGGSKASAYIHLARTVARRGERIIFQVHKEERINPEILKYVNRLSDLLFIVARHLNNQGQDDVLWS